jgi:transposase
LRLSYDQVRDFLIGTIRLPVSDGEMTAMLGGHAVTLRPEVERIKERINIQPGSHYDESGWRVQETEQGNHVWVKTGTDTTDTLFLLGRSRGKGNLDELKGPSEQPGVTDDYGAYRNAFATHALCWSHPDRDFRDLKNSGALTDLHRQHCASVYGEFAALYTDVRAVCATPFVLSERLRKKDELMARFEGILQPHPDDPPTLATAKQSLLARRQCYFVCVIRPGIPPDNNKAERALRHLVLKRKNCYGSKTQRMADRMSTLYSVLLSLWWKSKSTFFQEFAQLLSASP